MIWKYLIYNEKVRKVDTRKQVIHMSQIYIFKKVFYVTREKIQKKTPSGYRSYLSVVKLWVHFCFIFINPSPIPSSTTSFKSLHYYFFGHIHVCIPLFPDQFYILLFVFCYDRRQYVTATLRCSPPIHQITILSYYIIMPQFSTFKFLIQSNIDSSILSN